MKSKAIVLCILCGFLNGCHSLPKMQYNYKTNQKFTPWMTLEETAKYAKAFDTKNQWVTGLEGRWKNGIPEFRVRQEHAPTGCKYWWYWYYNQDRASFSKHLNKLADDGFTLVYYQSFERPDGNRRYQGVWHKIGKTNTVANAIPDEESAIRAAVDAWTPIYGKEKIESEKPYKAILKNGVWHVEGSLKEDRLGGVAEAEIAQKDGRIIRISHGK